MEVMILKCEVRTNSEHKSLQVKDVISERNGCFSSVAITNTIHHVLQKTEVHCSQFWTCEALGQASAVVGILVRTLACQRPPS